jgi:O-antigen/teichoic acid export membrane protein
VDYHPLEKLQLSASRLARLSREAFWIALGQVAAAAGLVVGVRVLTAVLPPAAYGHLALGMTAVVLAQQTIISPLGGAALRFFAAARDAGETPAFLRDLVSLLRSASLILLALALIAVVAIAGTGHLTWVALAITAVVFALLSGYSATLDGLQNALRQRAIVAWHNGVAPWLRFGLAFVAVRAFGQSGASAMAGYATGAALVFASQLWFFRGHARQAGVAGQRPWRARLLRYAWPFAVWGLFAWAQMASDRWALQAFAGAEDVGLYAVLYQLGYYPLALLSGWVSQLAAPVMFSRAGVGTDPARLRDSARVAKFLVATTLALTVVAAAAIVPMHQWLFSFLVAAEYRSVSWLLPWMVFSGGLFASGQVAALTVLSGADSRPLLGPKVVTSLIGAILNVVGAYAFGLPGVVAANLVFSATFLTWMLLIGSGARS